MTLRNPKKIWEKRVGREQVVKQNATNWYKLEYVEQVVQGEAGLQIYVEQVEQGEGGLQIVVEQVEQGQVVCPAEPLHLFQSVCCFVCLFGFRRPIQSLD